ncbi:MAG: DUF484 family protein, partial [Pseudomonadota bacterium]
MMVLKRAEKPDNWRERVLSDPELILEDRDLMRVLITANDRMMGGNVVDMRGIAMERLEGRLERLEDTHRSVIAAAYENLAGTNQLHRAVLTLLEQQEFEGFLKALSGEVASTLRVDRARLVLESAQAGDPGAPLLPRLQEVVTVAPAGFIKGYVTSGRNVPFRAVTLRQTGDDAEMVFGEDDAWIRSEALLQLDLGKGRRPAML